MKPLCLSAEFTHIAEDTVDLSAESKWYEALDTTDDALISTIIAAIDDRCSSDSCEETRPPLFRSKEMTIF